MLKTKRRRSNSQTTFHLFRELLRKKFTYGCGIAFIPQTFQIFTLTENASFDLHLNGDTVIIAGLMLEFNIGTSVNSVLTIHKNGNEDYLVFYNSRLIRQIQQSKIYNQNNWRLDYELIACITIGHLNHLNTRQFSVLV